MKYQKEIIDIMFLDLDIKPEIIEKVLDSWHAALLDHIAEDKTVKVPGFGKYSPKMIGKTSYYCINSKTMKPSKRRKCVEICLTPPNSSYINQPQE